MANEPIQNRESLTSFNERIKLLQEGVRNLLTGFLEEEMARQGPAGKVRKGLIGSLWAGLSTEKKSVPLEDIVGYVMKNCDVPSRIPKGIVEQRPLIIPFKKRIEDQPTILRDLSRIYRSVRDHNSIQRGRHRDPLMFGDIADNIVHHIYEIRNPANASLISQFIYLAGLCGFFFEELERERDLN